jgi:hypothetical protein
MLGKLLQDVSPGGPPLAEQIIEMRMDSFPRHPEAVHHSLGAVPAPEVLSAERPLLLLRASDERMYVYRLQLRVAVDDAVSAAPQLCLCKQPFDWLR